MKKILPWIPIVGMIYMAATNWKVLDDMGTDAALLNTLYQLICVVTLLCTLLVTLG